MNDIDKKITELEELMAKAMPGPLTMDEPDADGDVFIRDMRGQMVSIAPVNIATLIVAMRNALPELIAEIKRLKGALNIETASHDNTADELTHVESERDVALTRAEKAEAEVRMLQATPAEIEVREVLNCVISDLSRQSKEAEEHAKQMQAERDVLITNLVAQVGCPTPTMPEEIDCRDIGCRDCWLEWAAQEVAKHREEV